MSDTHEITRDAPVADWVTMETLTLAPEAAADRLLREAPVASVPFIGGLLLSSYQAIQQTMTDPAKHTVVGADGGTTDRAVGPSLMRREGTEHARQRNQILASLRPATVAQAWTKIFEKNARRRARDLIDAGPGANLDAVFARPYAADNLAAVIGLPDLNHQDVVRWSQSMVAASANLLHDPDLFKASDLANDQLDALITDAIPYLREHPDDSMLSVMLHSDDPLPLETIRANIKLAVSGGVNEPQHMIANGVWALSKHQVDASAMTAPEFARVFDEVARLYPPISLIAKKSRAQGYDLDGIRVPGDTVLVAFLLAANRDPGQFTRPLEFDVNRPRKPIASFGIGPHFCAGSHVAKSEVAAVAWPLLFRALRGLRAVDASAVSPTGWGFRSLPELPITWDAVDRSEL